MCNDEETFKKLHLSDTRIDYDKSDQFKEIKLVDNGSQYSRYINPYEKMVNLAIMDPIHNSNKFSFRARAFYEKAVEYSQTPSIAKMDSFNPIFMYIANPKDYRYYYFEGI